jgi:TRAP-type C4-dicarboxylate transport system permease small subunit
MDHAARLFYRMLLVLASLSMVAALLAITLNIATRLVGGWSISGLDGYAGYSIAAAFFLALPSALLHGDHIRVTSVLDHLPPRVRAWLVTWALVVGLMISSYLAWFSCRLVWMSHLYHDVAPTGDATPMWIPQLSMALGTVGFAVAFLHALVSQLRGQAFFHETTESTTRSE